MVKISDIRWGFVVGGLLACAAGLLWALQGAGVVGRSVMTGHTQWLVIGCVVFAVGLGLVYRGLHAPRTKA
jgi:hypothetical protein